MLRLIIVGSLEGEKTEVDNLKSLIRLPHTPINTDFHDFKRKEYILCI